MRPHLPPAALLALLAASCAGPGDPLGRAAASRPADPEPDPRPVLDLSGAAPAPAAGPGEAGPRGLVPAGEDPAVATVGERAIRASDVARFLFRFETAKALDVLNQILDAEILEADAAALGLALPAGEVEARTEQEVRRWESDVRVQYGPEMTLDRWLAERFGFTRESFRADLAALVRLRALRDRLVRYEAGREERVRIRVMVLDTEEKAREAIARLREGADFAALARQVSVVPPADLPPYSREEILPPELAEEVFSLEAGGVSRPVRVERDGRGFFQVIKVVERRPGREAPWASVAEEIERGLRERPVAAAEYLQWAARARARHGVRILLEEPGRDPGKGGGQR